jgi:hypothetical protein
MHDSRNATAITRHTVCWRLKKRANFITASFVSLWPTHGCRSPVRMRQWTICLRAGTRPRPSKLTDLGLAPDPQTFVSGNRLSAGTETRRPCGIDPARILHF